MLIALLSASLYGIVSAAVWDLNTDMNASTNEPNGIWTYGYAAGDPNNPDPNAIPIYKGLMVDSGVRVGANILWWFQWNGGVPHIWVGPEVGVPAGVHGMKPGYTSTGLAAEVPALIRWAAPDSFSVSTTVYMNASLYLTSGGLVDVYILKSAAGDPEQRKVLLAQKGVTTESPVAFSGRFEVIGGDTVDVMSCAHGPDDLANTDWAAVSITIYDYLPAVCQTQLPMDFNWDCYVNLEDFALFAQSWLDCNDASNPSCDK